MSKKNRAQHNVPRRHGDRNVQTRYSRKLQQEDCGCGRTCHEGVRGAGFTFIPEVKVSIKIGELHLHGDEHMETFNFHNGGGPHRSTPGGSEVVLGSEQLAEPM